MEIEEIEALMDANEYDSNLLYGLANTLRLDKEAKKEYYDRLTQDDFERINVAALLLSKLEQVGVENMVNVEGSEWRKYGDVFSKVKKIVDSLELEDIVDYVGFALGGSCFFHIVEKDLYRNYLYAQVRAILKKVKKPVSEKGLESSGRSLEEIRRKEDINDLSKFKLYVERTGLRAFWTDSSIGKGLKNRPEEIARGEFGAFLAGEGIFNKSAQFTEVPEGAGYSDMVSTEEGGVKRVFELKIISEKQDRFDEGLVQLYDYMCKEDVMTGYYLIFDARHSSKRVKSFSNEYSDKNKKIFVTVIDIHPTAPTQKGL